MRSKKKKKVDSDKPVVLANSRGPGEIEGLVVGGGGCDDGSGRGDSIHNGIRLFESRVVRAQHW